MSIEAPNWDTCEYQVYIQTTSLFLDCSFWDEFGIPQAENRRIIMDE